MGSDLWGALDAASGTGASIVVLISDGQADSQPTNTEISRIVAGAPAILLKVGTTTDNSFQQMADVTGGRASRWPMPKARPPLSRTLSSVCKRPR
jgi:hypothetical protein